MEIRNNPKQLHSVRQLATQDAQHDSTHHYGDVDPAEAQYSNDTTPAAAVQRFVQSTDEMSAGMAQFRNRREYDKKSYDMTDSFERVLDDDALPKANKIIQLASKEKISTEELLKQVRTLFPDDSDLILVLREMLRRWNLREVVSRRLEFLVSQVMEQADQKNLKAGINCALKSRLFGNTMELHPNLLRASYRSFLQSEAREIDIYTDWISNYGFKRRVLVLNYIESAIVADISSLDASCSNEEFGYLLGRLTQLKLLRSSEALFVHYLLTNPMSSPFSSIVKEDGWLLFMLSLLQQPQKLDVLFAGIVGNHKLLSEHCPLLQAIYFACKALPASLYFIEDGQEVALDLLRQMSDITNKHEQLERQRKIENASLNVMNLGG